MFERASEEFREEPLHSGLGLQGEVMVGQEVRQGLVYGGVEPCGDQRIVQAGALRGVVVNVVGGDHRHAVLAGESGKLAVALGIPL